MGESAALQKDGVERDLQLELAATPAALGEELTLVKREWATDVGPVDLMCRDENGDWVAVEIKRIGTIDAVEQLTRYLGFIREDPAKAACRGILAAQKLKPQAIALAEARRSRVSSASTRGATETRSPRGMNDQPTRCTKIGNPYCRSRAIEPSPAMKPLIISARAPAATTGSGSMPVTLAA